VGAWFWLFIIIIIIIIFQFCDVAKDELAKFDYRLDMKVEKKSELFCILGYLLELIIQIWQFEILIYFILKFDEFGPFFFPWKILCVTQNNIFEVEIWGNFTENKNTGWGGILKRKGLWQGDKLRIALHFGNALALGIINYSKTWSTIITNLNSVRWEKVPYTYSLRKEWEGSYTYK
jgi:hypothetical protein